MKFQRNFLHLCMAKFNIFSIMEKDSYKQIPNLYHQNSKPSQFYVLDLEFGACLELGTCYLGFDIQHKKNNMTSSTK